MCESDGFIPRFYDGNPKDKADRVLQDYETYTYNLINNETNLSDLLDSAVKEVAQENAKESTETDEDNAEKSEEDALEERLFNADHPTMTDEDYSQFNDFEENLKDQDNETLKEVARRGY